MDQTYTRRQFLSQSGNPNPGNRRDRSNDRGNINQGFNNTKRGRGNSNRGTNVLAQETAVSALGNVVEAAVAVGLSRREIHRTADKAIQEIQNFKQQFQQQYQQGGSDYPIE